MNGTLKDEILKHALARTIEINSLKLITNAPIEDIEEAANELKNEGLITISSSGNGKHKYAYRET